MASKILITPRSTAQKNLTQTIQLRPHAEQKKPIEAAPSQTVCPSLEEDVLFDCPLAWAGALSATTSAGLLSQCGGRSR